MMRDLGGEVDLGLLRCLTEKNREMCVVDQIEKRGTARVAGRSVISGRS